MQYKQQGVYTENKNVHLQYKHKGVNIKIDLKLFFMTEFIKFKEIKCILLQWQKHLETTIIFTKFRSQ